MACIADLRLQLEAKTTLAEESQAITEASARETAEVKSRADAQELEMRAYEEAKLKVEAELRSLQESVEKAGMARQLEREAHVEMVKLAENSLAKAEQQAKAKAAEQVRCITELQAGLKHIFERILIS